MPAIVEWAAMGGYAGYVWPAYGVALVVLGGFVLVAWRRYRLSIDQLARLQDGGRRG